jgi:hypothetical protein
MVVLHRSPVNAAATQLLVAAGRGALLLDLGSGAVVELNESAAFVWERSITGRDYQSIVRDVSDRYGIDGATSHHHVASALKIPQKVPEPAPTDFNYRALPDHFVFEFRGDPIFTIDLKGQEVSLCPQAPVTPERLPRLLHAFVPKILSLRGHFVLHAAAVAIDGRVLAFSGLSGAGKSTTAAALVAAGAVAVCDDQLVLVPDSTPVRVSRGAEATIDGWIASASSDLLASNRASCAELDRVRETDDLILAEIGFIDRGRRQGSESIATELAPTNVAGASFRHAFHGSYERAYWQRALQAAARVGTGVRGFELTLPATTKALKKVAVPLVARGTLRG